MDHDDAQELLKWFTTGKTPPSSGSLERIGYRGLLRLLSSSLVVAAELEFGDDADPDRLAQFANGLKDSYADASPPVHADSVVQILRMAMEVEDSELNMPTEELIATGMRIVFGIVTKHDLEGVKLLRYYHAVLAMVDSGEEATEEAEASEESAADEDSQTTTSETDHAATRRP